MKYRRYIHIFEGLCDYVKSFLLRFWKNIYKKTIWTTMNESFNDAFKAWSNFIFEEFYISAFTHCSFILSGSIDSVRGFFAMNLDPSQYSGRTIFLLYLMSKSVYRYVRQHCVGVYFLRILNTTFKIYFLLVSLWCIYWHNISIFFRQFYLAYSPWFDFTSNL